MGVPIHQKLKYKCQLDQTENNNSWIIIVVVVVVLLTLILYNFFLIIFLLLGHFLLLQVCLIPGILGTTQTSTNSYCVLNLIYCYDNLL